ncbi:Cna B-type domain-containing protein [Bifidobacterium sp. 82T25]|nr:Cna B-type domain-containing protein [Bifidobacterium miconisargentati]
MGEKTEGADKDKYHASIVKTSNANGYAVVIYNIHQPDSRSIDLTKTWDDADNQDGKRPEAIQVTVTGTSERPKDGGAAGKTEKYSETMIVTTLKVPDNADKNTWKWTLENLPKKNVYGYEYTYSVKETPVAGYNDFDDSGVCTVDKPTGTQCNVTFTKTQADADHPNEQFSITNTHKPETTAVTVSKVWDDAQDFNGQRPKQVTVWLLTSLWDQSNGWPEPQGDQCAGDLVGVSCAVLTAKNKATTETSDESKSDTADGADADTAGSESTPSKTEQTGSESTEQSQSGKTEQSGTDQSETAPSETSQSGQSASMQSESSDQPADGDATATDQTDTETPAGESNETDSKSDATKAATADTWTYTFKNLPKYRNGKLLRYSVTEEAVDDYTATFEDTTKYPTTSAPSEGGDTDTSATQTTAGEPDAYSFTLSNRNVPDKTDLNVYKVWNDNSDKDKTRPGSIWVRLYEKNISNTDFVFADTTTGPKITNADNSNLTAVGDPVELTAENKWSYTFTGISKHKQYEVREVNKDGTPVSALDGYYSPIITGNPTKGYTITNTSLPILPEAGGEGTTRILLLGMTLIALSGAFFGRKALAAAGKRNKKGDLR